MDNEQTVYLIENQIKNKNGYFNERTQNTRITKK